MGGAAFTVAQEKSKPEPDDDSSIPISPEKLLWIELILFGEERVAALEALAEVLIDAAERKEE